MSYDVEVWSAMEPNWQRIAGDLHGWKVSGRDMVYETSFWQIVAGPTARVEEEDIPEEIFTLLPGIQYLTEINLEPIHAPKVAHKALQRLAARIAKDYSGIISDQQTDTVTSPRGVKRIERAKPGERTSVINLGWWFNESPLTSPGGLARLVTTLEKYLPEALPRRYGPYEPPQYQYDKQGKAHLIEFLASETLAVVWYAHYPVLHFWAGIYGGYGPGRRGYRANHLSVEVHSSAWSQPGWDLALQRFWHEMSEFIHPFYAEVRLLHDYLFKAGKLLVDGSTESHPIRNGWWNGVPRQLGPAVVMDHQYAELWPGFVKKAMNKGGLYYVESHDWIRGKRVDQLVGGVPEDIAQGDYSQPPPRSGRTTYPKKWPFGNPYFDE